MKEEAEEDWMTQVTDQSMEQRNGEGGKKVVIEKEKKEISEIWAPEHNKSGMKDEGRKC